MDWLGRAPTNAHIRKGGPQPSSTGGDICHSRLPQPHVQVRGARIVKHRSEAAVTSHESGTTSSDSNSPPSAKTLCRFRCSSGRARRSPPSQITAVRERGACHHLPLVGPIQVARTCVGEPFRVGCERRLSIGRDTEAQMQATWRHQGPGLGEAHVPGLAVCQSRPTKEEARPDQLAPWGGALLHPALPLSLAERRWLMDIGESTG